MCIAVLCVSCIEKEEEVSIQGLEEKLDDQRFDIGRATEFVEAEKIKLADYEEAAADLKAANALIASLDEVKKSLEDSATRNSEESDVIELTEVAFHQYRDAYRKQARKAAIGKTIDLSATKGEKFKAVRILSITPLGLKVYLSSGPQSVPVRDLTPEVLDMLQMSQDEVTAYYEKQKANTVTRAEKFKVWKAGQAGRSKEEAADAIREKMKEIKEEIYAREDKINVRLQEIKGWKSKSSGLELRASQERNQSKSRQMERHADLARDRAAALSDANSDSWIVVGRLKAELEDLKRMGIR